MKARHKKRAALLWRNFSVSQLKTKSPGYCCVVHFRIHPNNSRKFAVQIVYREGLRRKRRRKHIAINWSAPVGKRKKKDGWRSPAVGVLA